ncbi:MAG: transposase [Candidatus Brocadiales bacterium]|nr:transposase [Candidatus Brocadiales bacterium]
MRPNRQLEENAKYHVMARANLQENIFIKDEDKDMVEEIVHSAKKKYRFRLKHFAVMNNHIHLLIQPIGKKENLSRIMKWILSCIATRYNRKYHRKGHVFYDRFKSKIVNGSGYYRRLLKYISNNPVKAKLSENIYSYRYSSLYHLMRKQYHINDEPDEDMLELFPLLLSKD